MEANHIIYEQTVNSMSYPEHSHFHLAILHLIAAEAMTLYRPTLSELRLHGYDMQIVTKHKQEIIAAAYHLSLVLAKEPSPDDRRYLAFLRERVRKMEADWDQVDEAQNCSRVSPSAVMGLAPAPRDPFFTEDKLETPESGANKAKVFVKGLVRSATKSQADLRGGVKRIFSKRPVLRAEEERGLLKPHPSMRFSIARAQE
jgi:hypothetical protein